MESTNPFWFGYYPGKKPLVRRPPKVFPGPQKLDFSQVAPEQLAVALDYYLDDVASGVKNTMELPKWLWDKTVDDWKKSFTASAMGYTPTGASTFEFLGAEGADIPGVNLSINLYDLVKDPHKTLQKFIEKQVVSGIDPLRRSEFWTDLDTSLTNRLYANIVKGKGGIVQSTISSNKDPISFFDQKIYAQAKVYSSDDATPRSLGATTQMTEGETDVYYKAGENFTGFVMNQKTTARRGKAYARLEASFIKAAATELEQKEAQIVGAVGMGGVALPEAARAKRLIDTFLDEAKVVEGLGEYNTRFTAVWGVAGSLSKKAFGGLGWGKNYATKNAEDSFGNVITDKSGNVVVVVDFGSVKADSNAAKARGDMRTYSVLGQMSSIGKNSVSLREEISRVRKAIEDYRTKVDAIIRSRGISVEDAKRYTEKLNDFNSRVVSIEAVMDRAEQLCARIDSAVKGTGISRPELESLIREQTAIAAKMAHQRYGGGVYNQYLMAVNREYFERDNFGRNSYFTRTDSTGAPIMSQGFRSLDPIYRYSKGQYLREDGGDLIEAVISGKYFERRYWYGKWRNSIQAFTPSYWTTKVLKRIGYFGLVYDDDDELDYFLNPKDPKTGEDVINVKHKIGRLLRPFTKIHRFSTSFTVTHGGISFKSGGKFEGGLYLSYLSNAWLRTDPANKAKLLGIVDTAGNWTRVGTTLEQKQAFISLINGDTAGFENATGLKYQMSGIADALNFNNAKKGAILFRKKILKNRKLVRSLGLELDVSGNVIQNDKNIAILDGLFGKLGQMDVDPATISPFLGKVGLLNFMSAKLTKIQQFEAKLLGRFISPFIKLREAIKNQAGKLFSKALYAILGTATGGVGAVLLKTLGPFLERVFNAFVSRFMKYLSDGVSKAFKALIKGDIDKAIDALAGEAAKMLAWIMACGCSIPILLILFVMLLFSPIIASISPISRSSSSSSTAPGGGVPPTGSTTSGKFFRKYGAVDCNKPTICGSFKGGLGCHGTNGYWGSEPSKQCIYNVPIGGTHPNGIGLRGTSLFTYNPTNPTNGPVCSIGRTVIRMPSFPNLVLDGSNTGPEYGYAADYASACAGESIVYLPTFDNVKRWRVSAPFDSGNGTGFGVYLSNVDCGGPCASSYTLLVLHINSSVRTGELNVGEAFASLFPGPPLWVPHVHTELRKGASTVLEPETVL